VPGVCPFQGRGWRFLWGGEAAIDWLVSVFGRGWLQSLGVAALDVSCFRNPTLNFLGRVCPLHVAS
jgi:hypothetical protein